MLSASRSGPGAPGPADSGPSGYGASPYAELGRPAPSPEGMPAGLRMQERLRDSRAGRLLGNTGALGLLLTGPQEAQQLDGTTAAPRSTRMSRSRAGDGGGSNLPPQGYHRFINYPRWGKRGFRRWMPSWKLITGTFTLCLLAMVGVIFWFYNSVEIPTEDPETLAQTTTVYYSNGDVMGKLSVQNRENVELANVPETVRNAVLAAEDHTFYTNSGINPTSIIRAALAAVQGGAQQGGSTISQQYVKNVYDQRELSYKRKLNEAVLAIKINREIDKDTILERYLNTIYWGRGAWGIQAASKAYFNKDVSKLTVSEGAFLAGIINSPENADPRDDDPTHAERAERRWGVVLDAMVSEGWLDSDERDSLEFPKVVKEKQSVSVTGQAAYLMEMVKAEAEDEGIPEDKLTTGGYEIHTTFNKRLVAAGQKAVKEWTDGASKRLRVGMASINPSNGAVLAIYGGTDINKQLNQATKDRTQAGSTFKPFTLIAALEDGVSLNSYFDGSNDRRIVSGVKKISNFGNESLGWIDLVTATAESVNTVYVDLNNQIGPAKTQQAAIDAGIPKDTPDLGSNLVNVLGTASVHPIDLATAYATFASQGMYREWHVITKITSVEDGSVVYKVPSSVTKGTRVFDADAVADATYAMEHVISEGSGTYAEALGRDVAGKTGTTSDNKAALFAGFTPQVATVVALHQVAKDGTSLESITPYDGFSEITGGTIPIRIWTSYMEAALKGKDNVEFPDPTYGGEVTQASPTPEVTETATPTPTESVTPTEMPSATASVTSTDEAWPTETTTDDTTSTDTSTTDTTETDDGSDDGSDDGGGMGFG